MKGRCVLFFAVLAALMIVQPVPASAESVLRLIPTGTVNLVEDGKSVGSFRSEMPLPQGMLMACKGSCIVQSQSLQLVARDEAVFALAEAAERWDLTVKTGRVDFTMRSQVKPVTFHTPHDTLQTQQVIVPAGNNGLVRGYVVVTDGSTELHVTEGALQMTTRNGSQRVHPGHSIQLAQAVIAPPGEAGNGSPSPGANGFAGMDTPALAAAGLGTAGIMGATIWFLTESDREFVSPK